MQKIIEQIIDEAASKLPVYAPPGAAYPGDGSVYIEENDPNAFPGNGAAEYYATVGVVNPDIGM